MDFFATGGFQQLFSDLDEHVIEHDYQPMADDYNNNINSNNDDNEYNKHNDSNFTQKTPQYQHQNETVWLTNNESVVTEVISKNEDFLCMAKQVSCYKILKSNEEDEKDAYTINVANEKRLIDVIGETTATAVASTASVSRSMAIDWNNNSFHSAEIQLNEKQLQFGLDLLLPMAHLDVDGDFDEVVANRIDTDDFSTDYFITREMADWEERFLDNYIEIPELIDFLPEKTPLCTDECESFLQESTKNLRLHRKQRKQRQATTTTSKTTTSCDTPKAGFTCSFGDCRKVYAKPAHLKAHLRRHLGEKPYVCNWPDCTWRFSRSDELARHRRSHSGVKPYKCDYCTKCFARSDHLTKHRKVHERRLLAASKAGKVLDTSALPYSILTVRPGRKRKNQIC